MSNQSDTTPDVKHLCPVCGDEYNNTGYHAEACTGTRATGVRTVPADDAPQEEAAA